MFRVVSSIVVSLLLIFFIKAIVLAKPVNFSESQIETLQFACSYGKMTNLAKTHPDDACYIFSAIAWQESGAGLDQGFNKGGGHIAYGVFQNYLPTVRKRFQQKGYTISDSEIKELLRDRYYSAIMAEEELSDWMKYRKGNLYKALASYYGGWKWERATWYADAVTRKMNYLKKHGKFLEDKWEKNNIQLISSN